MLIRFLSLAALTIAVTGPAGACETKPAPKGAMAVGYTKIAFDFCPTRSDISMSGKGSDTLLYKRYVVGPEVGLPLAIHR